MLPLSPSKQQRHDIVQTPVKVRAASEHKYAQIRIEINVTCASARLIICQQPGGILWILLVESNNSRRTVPFVHVASRWIQCQGQPETGRAGWLKLEFDWSICQGSKMHQDNTTESWHKRHNLITCTAVLLQPVRHGDGWVSFCRVRGSLKENEKHQFIRLLSEPASPFKSLKPFYCIYFT